MKYYKPLFLLALISLLFSCATPVAYVDFDHKTNFDEYTTYNFYAPETDLSIVEEDTIMGFIEKDLQAKGLESQVISKFSIDFYVEFIKLEDSFISSTGNTSYSYSSPYMVMTISFTDALTSELFWQAVVERKVYEYISKEKRIELYQKFVKEALSKYPPSAEDIQKAEKEKTLAK